MPEESEQLSPEEKLLRVMQGSEDDEDGGEELSLQAESSEQASPATRTEKLSVAEKTGMNQVSASPAPEESDFIDEVTADREGDGRGRSGEEQDVGNETPGSPKPLGSPEQNHVIRIVSRVIALVIACLILFSAIEVWAHVHKTLSVAGWSIPDDSASRTGGPAATDQAEDGLVALPKVLEAFQERPILTGLDVAPTVREGPTIVDPPWIRQLREQYDLIGTSTVGGEDGVREAILVDKKDNKMHFLRVGQSLAVDKREFEVAGVADGKVVLRHGERDIEIE